MVNQNSVVEILERKKRHLIARNELLNGEVEDCNRQAQNYTSEINENKTVIKEIEQAITNLESK